MLPSVYVITPTIGGKHLERCVRSVKLQTYRNIKHIVVFDGVSLLNELDCVFDDVSIIKLPFNTGGDGYLGGKIYDAVCSLVSDGYVAFLDDDNFYDPNHIENCILSCEKFDLDWCYSLRKLVSQAGEFLCFDNCNSLGYWPSYDGFYHHVDTNCYFMRSEIASEVTHMLRKKAYVKGEQEGDRSLAKTLLGSCYRSICTSKYTVNYMLKGHQDYSDQDVLTYYLNGNKIMENIYNIYPWAALKCDGTMSEHPTLGYSLGE